MNFNFYLMKYTRIIKALSLASAIVLMLGSCRSRQQVSDTFAYYNFGTTLIDVSPSGMLTVRAWGNGPDEATSVEEAKKGAVSELIFKGFSTSSDYNARALVTEVNARERYAGYFDRFFAKGGEYRKFVREASSTDKSRARARSTARENHGVTVVIDRNALRQQLIDDGVLAR